METLLKAIAAPVLSAVLLSACHPAHADQPEARQSPPKADAAHAVDTSAVVGTWYGVASTVGTIELRADGSYSYGGAPGGAYRVVPDGILFTGDLAAWNGGKATLKDGTLEFYWTTAAGAKQWFSFAKGD